MHPSRSGKGCYLCKPHKRRGDSERKYPPSVKRRLGQKRRMHKRVGVDD